MTFWQFNACLDGYNAVHGDHKPEPPTDEEYADALRRNGFL
jgi:hypothetical protein